MDCTGGGLYFGIRGGGGGGGGGGEVGEGVEEVELVLGYVVRLVLCCAKWEGKFFVTF